MTTSQHGTYSRYTHGCKCRPCKDANAQRSRDYHKKKRPYTKRRGNIETADNADLLSKTIAKDNKEFWKRVHEEGRLRDFDKYEL